MKRTTLVLAGLALSLMSSAQLSTESHRPEAGDFLVGIQVNPNFLTSNGFFFPQQPNQVLVQGLNVRYYSSERFAHQVQLNYNGTHSDYGRRNFSIDDTYTYEISQSSTFVSASYGFMWVYNFGQNWQVVYGPGARFDYSIFSTNYDYSHTAQELSDANQAGNYFEDSTVPSYTMGVGFGAEVNYFISKNVYVGLSTALGVQSTVNPSRTVKYTQIYPGFMEVIETEIPGTSTTTFTSQQPIYLTLGVAF